MILVMKYEKTDLQHEIVDLYLKNVEYINKITVEIIHNNNKFQNKFNTLLSVIFKV